MPAIEYTLLNQISVTNFAQDVEVMGRSGSRIRVPCLGFTNKRISESTNGHFVKVIAERYSEGNAHAHCDWKYVSVDEAVLGWRTNEGNEAKGNWIVYLLVDDKGVPIIVPRSSRKPLRAAG
jgi:hypothetical protein